MKVLSGMVLSAMIYAGSVLGGEISTRVWQISDLKDESNATVLGMVLDVEYAKSVFRVNGVMFFDDGAAGAVGTGYAGEAPGIYYVYLNVAHHFFLVSLDASLNGTIDLYTPDSEVFDSGTVTYEGME